MKVSWRDVDDRGEGVLPWAREMASDAFGAFEALTPSVWAAADASDRVPLVMRMVRVVAAQTGLSPLAAPRAVASAATGSEAAGDFRAWPDLDSSDRIALAFAEQMAFDVGSLTPAETQALFGALGGFALPFVQSAYVADFVPRADAALAALFGPSRSDATPVPPPSPGATADLMAAFDPLIRRVPQLTAVDPLMTELVRLRGARIHRCRLCQSLRSRKALTAGGDEAQFAAVDTHRQSDLEPAQKAALAWTDAMLTVPVAFPSEAVALLRGHFSPAAALELVLDITRNATNKVAVALGADAPHVDEGIEVYDIDDDGELHYGLEAP